LKEDIIIVNKTILDVLVILDDQIIQRLYKFTDSFHRRVFVLMFIHILTHTVIIRAQMKWWAQYMESNGEMDVAVKYYQAAQDYLSLVRIYCFTNHLDKVGSRQASGPL